MGSMNPPQSSTAQETSQNALTNMWDDTAKQLAIAGGMTDPALVISGGQQIAFNSEQVNNSTFASDLTGWINNGAAIWDSAGNIKFYMGALSSIAVSSGGTGYQVGDVVALSGNATLSPINMSADNTPPPYVVTGDWYGSSSTYARWHLFDNGASEWSSVTVPGRAAIYLGTKQILGRIGFKATTYGFPTAFTVSGSNTTNADYTNEAHWTTLLTVTGGSYPGINMWAYWDVPNTTAYLWYRFRATAVHDASGCVMLREWMLYTDQSASGGSATVLTAPGGVIGSVAIANGGKQYIAGKTVPVSGGHGSGAVLSVSAVSNGAISQSIATTVGNTYKTSIELPTPTGGYFLESGCGGSSQGITSNYNIAAPASATTTNLSITWYGTAIDQVGIINSMSMKSVQTFCGSTFEILGSDGQQIDCTLGLPSSLNADIKGIGSAPYFVTGKYVFARGAALGELRGGNYICGAGYHAGSGITCEDGGTFFGAQAGDKATGREITAFGYLAGAASVSVNNAYGTFLGCAAGYAGALPYSLVAGLHSGWQGVGNHNIWFAINDGASAFPTVNNSFIVSPNSGTSFLLYAIHDASGTTGYLNLRGAFRPDADNTYNLGSTTDLLRWKHIPLTGSIGCWGVTPPAAQKTFLAAPTLTGTYNDDYAAIQAWITKLQSIVVDYGFEAGA